MLVPLMFAAVSVSQTLPPVQGPELFGGQHVTIDFASPKKSTVLIFVSAKCPCSLSHHQHLQELSEQFSEFAFVGVHSNVDESLEYTRENLKGQFKFKIIQDSNSEIANRFKAFKTPHAFVIDRNGNILYRGGVSSSADFSRSNKFFLKEALNDIQAAKPVRIAEGRTLGCIITRSSK